MSRPTVSRALMTSAVVLGLLSLSATSQEGEEKSKDWRLGYDQKFDWKLNVFRAQLTSDYFVFTQVYDTFPYNWRLSDAGPDKQYSLVTDHEISDDGLVYTFHLREGVKWNDGEDFTADDVVWSYNAFHTLPSSVLAGYVRNMKSIDALDDYTVRYTLNEPDARVLSAYTPVLPEHIYGSLSNREIATYDAASTMVGTGPYMLTQYDPTGTTILEPNPHFWGPKGQIERILMIKYGDKEGQLRDIKLNQLDAVMLGDSKWVENIEGDPDLTAYSIPTPGFSSIAFNMCPPGGGDPKNTCTGPAEGVNWQVVQDRSIRLALSWAIDRENLVRTVFQGQAVAGNGLISPFYEGKGYYESYLGDPEIGFTYDPDKAQQILADGGWDCPPEGICEKDGIRAQFELLIRAENLEDQNAGRRIQAWARFVGIQIDISIITEDALYERNYPTSPEDPDKYEPDYDAFIWGWGGDLPTPDFNFEVLRCGDYWQDTFYCNPEYDPLPGQALQTLDFDERVAIMHEAERIFLRDSPYLILAHNNDIEVTRNDTWTGYHPSPEPNGYPFLTSWLQLQLLRPGQAASPSYAGAPAVILILSVSVIAVFLASRWRRHREETGPLELAPAEPSSRELVGAGKRSR